MPHSPLHARVLRWYATHRRDLPWRDRQASPWSVLVSEVMLQQTPVARVLPVYEEWIRLWPRPADLAVALPADAVRCWGTLGYPRRALRLHEAAVAIVRRHRGLVPSDSEALLELPGVGAYTAAAVASFAFGQRQVVLDTNVRRVLARVTAGAELPARSISAAERSAAESLLPGDPAVAAAWSVAVMELGALTCTSRAPRCAECPIEADCAWRAAGMLRSDAATRPAQTYEGTDRQCRGRLLAVLRNADGPVHRAALEAAWDIAAQRERSLAGLVADGLVEPTADGRYQLPTVSSVGSR
jgi:A/G-specific adenine glycosylase